MDKREIVIQVCARAGYAARGTVFTIIGIFALLAAAESRRHTVGTKGALEALLAQPLGRGLLWIVAAGLLGFAIWRVIQSVFDFDDCGSDKTGVARRLAMLGGAAVNAALSALALCILFGFPVLRNEDAVARDWTAWLLAKPFGQWLVMLVGPALSSPGLALSGRPSKRIFGSRSKRVQESDFGSFYLASSVM